MVAFLDLASVVAPLSSVATSHALAWTVALLFLVWLFKKWCLPWLRTWLLLRSVPGPGDWIPFWFLACALWGNRRRLDKENFTAGVFRVITELSKLHEGKTFKAYIGIIPIVGVHTPNAVQAVLTAELKSDKPSMYKFLKPWLGSKNILMIGGDPWRSKRKLFMQGFQASAMENYCDFIGKSADCLVARIEKMLKEAPDEPIRCLDNVQKCALDIIGRVILGVDLGVQGENHGNYSTYFHLLPVLVSMRFFQPWTWLDELYILTHNGRLFRETMRKIKDITGGVTNTRKAELQKLSNHTADSQALEKNQDGSGSLFMDSLLLAHMKAPSSYTLDDVGKDADFMMLAGGDSSSCAISWSIYLFGLHPDIQRKVQEELDVVFKDRENMECTQEDLKRLQYMECCVKETLRLCPPFPYYGKVLDQDLTLDGCTLPKGVSCFINLFSLHRNPNEFERPEEYVPERFLSDEDTYHHPFSYVPFSAGPKNCLGQKFVMMEIKVVLAKVLSKFTVEATRPLQELEMTFDIVLKAKGGLPVLFRKRNQT
ncbi:cytochrome P450 4V2 isoform X12 [Dermacentor silvarum]|uniref:cytochrome P450 4V2 isoform X12 n=1 Tax=Dermacentor silvarum TaxID=543639 RepID=UPI002100C291|nr:cytochrome P450 4V2 isoform X12 [Dermacentor silvarum]